MADAGGLALTARTRRLVATPELQANLPIGLGLLALVLWGVAVTSASFARMGQLGLVTVLPATYWLGLVVACGALCLELVRPGFREGLLALLVAILVLYVFGTACAVEPTAALASSWIHAGFVQFISTHGYALNGFDAEFSWPGAFSMFALLGAVMGQHHVLDLLRWFPLAIELAYLAPLVVISRRCGVNRRAGWLGIAFFYLTNWIYQDYFSPQALNLLFFLVVVALVLWAWEPAPLADPVPERLVDRARSCLAALRVTRLRGEEATPTVEPRTLLAVLGLLVVIVAASAMSHQLTPYAMLLAFIALLLTRRLGRPELIVLTLLLAFGWLSLGASNYWIGHLSDIFQFGQLSSILGQNVSSRVTGSASHRLIVDVRILLTVALFGLAALGALRRAATSRVLELLAVSQFAVLGAQSYGGEGLLRVALLSGPFAGLLAASAILPSRTGPLPPILADRVELPGMRRSLAIPWPRRRVAAGVACFAVAACFGIATTIVRGGNDNYESFTTGEVSAANYVYGHLAPGQTVGLVAPYAPLGSQGLGSVNVYVAAPAATVPKVTAVGPILVKHRPKLILLGPAQAAWGVILGGYPAGWESGLRRYLQAHHYVVVGTWSTAWVLQFSTARATRAGH